MHCTATSDPCLRISAGLISCSALRLCPNKALSNDTQLGGGLHDILDQEQPALLLHPSFRENRIQKKQSAAARSSQLPASSRQQPASSNKQGASSSRHSRTGVHDPLKLQVLLGLQPSGSGPSDGSPLCSFPVSFAGFAGVG